MNVIWMGFLASLVAGLCTVAGTLGVYIVRRLSARLEDGLPSLAAGIMLAASFFSLLLPAIDYGTLQFGNRNLAVIVVIVGILTGAAGLFFLHRYLPREHFLFGPEGPDAKALGAASGYS